MEKGFSFIFVKAHYALVVGCSDKPRGHGLSASIHLLIQQTLIEPLFCVKASCSGWESSRDSE